MKIKVPSPLKRAWKATRDTVVDAGIKYASSQTGIPEKDLKKTINAAISGKKPESKPAPVKAPPIPSSSSPFKHPLFIGGAVLLLGLAGFAALGSGSKA